MKIAREQTELLLMEYAAGTLDAASSLLAACYITLCPEARRYVGACEAVGGTLMASGCDPVTMRKESLKAVLNKLDELPQEPRPMPEAAPPPQSAADFPVPFPVLAHMQAQKRRARWQRFTPGLRFCALEFAEESPLAILYRLAPRARAARHSHRGTEMTLVMSGGFYDEYGRYGAGDVIIADESITHQPVATDEGCLCLSIADGPVYFTSGAYRLLNILFR